MGVVESTDGGEPSVFKDKETRGQTAGKDEEKNEGKTEKKTEGKRRLKLKSAFKGRGDKQISEIFATGKATMADFEVEKYIGQGAYGKVMRVHHKKTKQVYAMKMLEKDYIRKNDQVLNIFTERGILSKLNHPFIVSLQYAFQTKTKLYFVMDYCSGGDFFGFLKIKRKFTESETRFYAGEIALALDCLHRHDIVYRDLKPENMLLDRTGHIKMTDFGLSKNLSKENLMKTFCGSTTYLAPEVIVHKTREKGYTKAVDWWSFGVMFYEMLTGLPAFYDRNTQLNYVKIMYANIPMHKNFSRSCRSLIFDLLEKKPDHRIGRFTEVKYHPFFKTMDWDALLAMQVKVPLKPTWEVEEEGPLTEVLNEVSVDLRLDDAEENRKSGMGSDFNNFSFFRSGPIAGSYAETWL